jgi:6-phosphogluconolactonase
MTTSAEIRVFPNPQDLFQAGAEEFARCALEAVKSKNSFNVVLSGGSTPREMYSLLATKYASQLAWDKICFFWGDERHVPRDHADSNYRMAHDALLAKVPVKPENIYRVPTENSNPELVAENYERTLRKFFKVKEEEFPRFDLVLLGMGVEGHTASLFPGTRAVLERHRLVTANWVEKFQTYRITFTVPVLNAAAAVMFMVTGKDKERAVASVFDDRSPAEQFPAKMVQPSNGSLIWLLDQEAAGSLPASGRGSRSRPFSRE